MYRGKRIKKLSHMSKRAVLLVLSLVMILSVSVGGTLAYLIAQSETRTNVFEPGDVTTETKEDFTPNGNKSDVKISTKGSNVDTYVRAKIVVTWVDKDGNVLAQKPKEGTDYTISINEGDDWMQGDDGFWYCREVVKAGKETPVLITNCYPKENMGPVDAQLQVTILSQAIQASGDAASEAFSSVYGVMPFEAN